MAKKHKRVVKRRRAVGPELFICPQCHAISMGVKVLRDSDKAEATVTCMGCKILDYQTIPTDPMKSRAAFKSVDFYNAFMDRIKQGYIPAVKPPLKPLKDEKDAVLYFESLTKTTSLLKLGDELSVDTKEILNFLKSHFSDRLVYANKMIFYKPPERPKTKHLGPGGLKNMGDKVPVEFNLKDVTFRVDLGKVSVKIAGVVYVFEVKKPLRRLYRRIKLQVVDYQDKDDEELTATLNETASKIDKRLYLYVVNNIVADVKVVRQC